jgi:hypothetical protein
MLLNKYVGGLPYTVSLLDLSESGARVRCLLEPETPDQRFALELEVPRTGDRMWLWARQIWRRGRQQALAFSGLTPGDREMLRTIIAGGEPV